MLKKEEITLIISLGQNPEMGTPMDFEMVAGLLGQYPDFDLLRKVFVELGHKLGAKGENFEKEVTLWNLKKGFFEKEKVTQEEYVVDSYSPLERIGFFLRSFEVIHSPSEV